MEAIWGQLPSPGHPPHPPLRLLRYLRSQLHGLPHVAPFRTLLETPTAAYATRQHLFANLYDRLSTRPFLTGLEKRCGGGGGLRG